MSPSHPVRLIELIGGPCVLNDTLIEPEAGIWRPAHIFFRA
jgi:hypothetical protein